VDQERRRRRTRARPHPLVAKVRGALPRPRAAAGFLRYLERRLQGLEAVAAGADPKRLVGSPPEAARARRFLAARREAWDDGDETLVRAYLDGWTRPGEDESRAAVRRLAGAALALAALEVRPQTLWFFLWEMESVLRGLRRARARRP
jgi:hypothetical protein